MRETEAWLSGEITTPRAIVTSNALQVLSPDPNAAGQGAYGNSSGFLGYGGRWRLEGAAEPSPSEQASHLLEETGQLQLPFPNVVESPGHNSTVLGEGSPPFRMDSLEKPAYDPDLNRHRQKTRAMPKRRQFVDEEAALPVPPHRTARALVFQNTREAHEENSIARHRHREEAQASAKSWEPEGRATRRDVSPRSQNAESLGQSQSSRMRRRRPSECSENEMTFVEPEDHLASPLDDGDSPTGLEVRGQSYGRANPGWHAGQEAAPDYYAMRSRMGNASSAPRAVTLRQR